MTIIQHFDARKDTVFVVWVGTVTPQDWFSKAENLASHPLWAKSMRLLADVRSVQDTSSISVADMQHVIQILTRDPSPLKGKRLAILARDQFGRARQFSHMIGRFGISSVVFNNLDTACLFLGMDTAYAYQTLVDVHQQAEGG